MKFSKILLVLAAFATLAFAEEAKTEEDKPEEVKSEKAQQENISEAEKIRNSFPEPEIKTGIRSKEQCEQGYQLLQGLYAEIEKNPKCTYNQEYADEHNYVGDYTMTLDNRDYFCNNCLSRYLKLGNPMVNSCGENAPNEMVYDLYFLSAVNSIICAKDQLKDKYCEVVIDELFNKEKKPIISWKEDSLCGECPYYYHNLFKEREEFYKSVSRDSADNSFIGRLLPLRDIELDCFKEFDVHRNKVLKEAKDKAEEQATKNIDYNDLLKEAAKEEHDKNEKEAEERAKEKKTKEEKKEETEKKEENEKKEEKQKKANDEL